MRRLISLVATLAIVAAGCGGTPASPTGAATNPPQAPASPGASADGPASLAPTTLRVLVHQNPPFTEFMNTFNADFQANHPRVTVDMSIVAPADLATTTQTRLTANDVDVVDMFAFDTAVQPFMKEATPPIWQTLADAGSLLDLTDQPFVQNYDPNAIADAGT